MPFPASVRSCVLLASSAAAFLVTATARAEWPWERAAPWEKPTMTRPLTQYEKLQRAGCPHNVAWWAQPNYDKYDDGYYGGGGAAYNGEPGTVLEGTWGWDYCHPITKVRLNYHRGWRYQQGGGLYEPNAENNPTDHLLGTYQPSGFSIRVKKNHD